MLRMFCGHLDPSCLQLATLTVPITIVPFPLLRQAHSCPCTLLTEPLFRFGIIPVVEARDSLQRSLTAVSTRTMENRHVSLCELFFLCLVTHRFCCPIFIHPRVIAAHLDFYLAAVYPSSHPYSTQYQPSSQSRSMSQHAWSTDRPKIVAMRPQILMFNKHAIYTEACKDNS